MPRWGSYWFSANGLSRLTVTVEISTIDGPLRRPSFQSRSCGRVWRRKINDISTLRGRRSPAPSSPWRRVVVVTWPGVRSRPKWRKQHLPERKYHYRRRKTPNSCEWKRRHAAFCSVDVARQLTWQLRQTVYNRDRSNCSGICLSMIIELWVQAYNILNKTLTSIL